MNKKKIAKVILIGVIVDTFYGHLYAVWRNVSPRTFNMFFKRKDEYYKELGIDRIWKKKNKD